MRVAQQLIGSAAAGVSGCWHRMTEPLIRVISYVQGVANAELWQNLAMIVQQQQATK
jgi:hypothetical protein